MIGGVGANLEAGTDFCTNNIVAKRALERKIKASFLNVKHWPTMR